MIPSPSPEGGHVRLAAGTQLDVELHVTPLNQLESLPAANFSRQGCGQGCRKLSLLLACLLAQRLGRGKQTLSLSSSPRHEGRLTPLGLEGPPDVCGGLWRRVKAERSPPD